MGLEECIPKTRDLGLSDGLSGRSEVSSIVALVPPLDSVSNHNCTTHHNISFQLDSIYGAMVEPLFVHIKDLVSSERGPFRFRPTTNLT